LARRGTRAGRVADQMQREIAQILRSELKDPRVGGLVTVTAVELSPDLAYAKVLFTVLGDADAVAESSVGLRSAAGFVRTVLGRRMSLRVVPHLTFEFDASVARGVHISTLIDRALAPAFGSSDVPSQN
jgi:ribosome-binding factor A